MIRAPRFSPMFQILTAVVVVVALFIFNSRTGRIESVEQRKFESWLAVHDQPTEGEKTEAVPPSVVVTLTGRRSTTEAPIQWELRSTDSPEIRERALRILQIAREANLFSVGQKVGDDIGLVLEVHEGEDIFRAGITDSLASSNLRVGNLLRLFEEYATKGPSTVVAAQSTTQN